MEKLQRKARGGHFRYADPGSVVESQLLIRCGHNTHKRPVAQMAFVGYLVKNPIG